MYIAFLVAILSVLSAYLARYKQFKNGLKISFFIIFFFSALRYNYGSDYPTYLSSFLEIQRATTITFFDFTRQVEPGWYILCWIFKPFGFFALTAFLSLFNCFVFYRFINKYLPVNYYWIAVFLYVYTPELMLLSFSGFRQYAAIALFVISIDYLNKKDAIRYFLCIGMAMLIHTSAVVLFPLFLLRFLKWKLNRVITVIIFVSFFISLFTYIDFLNPILNQFVTKYFGRYNVYQNPIDNLGSGLIILYLSILLILTSYYHRDQNKETALIFKIAIISILIYPLVLIFELVVRVAYYFTPATIIAYPIIFKNMKNPIFRTIFLLVIIFATLYQFYRFMISDIWSPSYGVYQTIFSAPHWY